MQIKISARHCELTDFQKRHTEQEITRLNRYSDHILTVDVIVAYEKYGYIAELNIHLNGLTLTSKEEAPDIQAAIDKVMAKMEPQLKKHNAKRHDHRVKREV